MRKLFSTIALAALAACKAGSTGPAGPQGPMGTMGNPGTMGSMGTAGESVTSAALAVGDANCPAGGVQLTSASGTAYVCNGLPGPSGTGGGTLGPGVVNVRAAPYNAKGDGTTDDTAAFQNALNDVGALGGGIVFAPTGNYSIATHLSVPPHTTLEGVFRAPTAYAQNKGTTLLAQEGAGNASGTPFITLTGPNSVLEGVAIFYPNQVLANPPTAYPWTIQGGGGDNVTVQNVLLVNPYNAIDLGTNPSGRHLVRGVYGQPLRTGISVDQCYDIGRIMDIHFWPFWTQDANIEAYQSANAFSFVFYRTDWEVVQDVFSWGYHVGAMFNASSHGAMNGQMSNINFDNVDVGLDVYATQPYAIHVSNLNLANAGGGSTKYGIFGEPGSNAAQLNVTNASFWGSFNKALDWENGGLVSMSGSRLVQWNAANPAIDLLAGRAMIHDNFFADAIGVAVHIAGTDRVMVSNNELTGNTLTYTPSPLILVQGNQM